jgi:hypothetical protein
MTHRSTIKLVRAGGVACGRMLVWHVIPQHYKEKVLIKFLKINKYVLGLSV